MASLIKRSNGIFYAISSEKRRRSWTSLRTRDVTQATALFKAFIAERERRTILFLSDFAEDFCLRARLNVAATTVGIYRAAFASFIRLCGDKPIKSLSPLDLERFKALRAKEVKAVTVNIDLRSLRAAFNDAVRMKLLDVSPCVGMRPLRFDYAEAAFLSQSDTVSLLRVINDTGFKNLVLFAIYTMIRLGELIRLGWEDVDFKRRELRIQNKEGFRVKGGRPRVVPMNDWVFQYLGSLQNKSGPVFKNSKGIRLLPGSVSHKFKRYVRQAELDDRVHFHSLRHTGISLLVNQGVSPVHLQRIAGHSSIQTTDIYTHTEDRSLQQAVSRFPSLN